MQRKTPTVRQSDNPPHEQVLGDSGEKNLLFKRKKQDELRTVKQRNITESVKDGCS